MLLDGFTILVIGMATVFVFLSLLVGLMKTVSYFLYDDNLAVSLNQPAGGRLNTDSDEIIAVVIAAARQRGI